MGYTNGMGSSLRHFYGYKRQPQDAPDGCDETWLDWPGTERQERDDMLLALRPGDAVVVLAKGDLGTGREIPAMVEAIQEAGAVMEIFTPEKAPPARQGRPPTFDPTPEQDAKIRRLYHSRVVLSHVLKRASEIMGYEVKRYHLTNKYGARWKRTK